MSKTTVITIFLLLIGLVYFAAIAVAQPTGPDSITPGLSERGNVSNVAQSTEAQAGNVTALNIDATAITTAWQGYYGNITGSITLEDANSNVFYNWSGLGTISGEVYASRSNAVTWASINCTNSTQNAAENSYLGKVVSDPDSIEGTFSSATHPAFSVGVTSITSDTCNATNAYGSGGPGSDFYQVLLADGSSNIVYTTIIDENTAGFNGVTSDFQLLVGENGNESSPASTTYYFYIELS